MFRGCKPQGRTVVAVWLRAWKQYQFIADVSRDIVEREHELSEQHSMSEQAVDRLSMLEEENTSLRAAERHARQECVALQQKIQSMQEELTELRLVRNLVRS